MVKIESIEGNKTQNQHKALTLNEIWVDFFTNTGLHGCNKLYQGSSLRSIVWTLGIIASLGGLLYTIVVQVQDYNKHQTFTTVQHQFHDKMDFPVVTICSLSPRSKNRSIFNERRNNFWLSVSSQTFLSVPINWSDPAYKDEGYFKPRTEEELLLEAVDINVIFKSCIFNMIKYNCSQLFKPLVTFGGVCYSLNRNLDLKTSHYGSMKNLVLTIDVNEEDFTWSFDMSAGIKVMIEDKHQFPNTFDGVLLAPGQECNIEISEQKVKSLLSPFHAYGESYCIDNKSPEFVDPFTYPYKYRNGTICSLYEFNKCVFHEYVANGRNISSRCNCMKPCEYMHYISQATCSRFPSKPVGELWYSRGIIFSTEKMTNYIYLKIHFRELKTEIIEQVAKYSSYGQILAIFGGQIGLFLGASILTFAEVIELFLNLLKYTFVRLKRCLCE